MTTSPAHYPSELPASNSHSPALHLTNTLLRQSSLVAEEFAGFPFSELTRTEASSSTTCFSRFLSWPIGSLSNLREETQRLQVIPLAIHWIRTWSYIQAEEQRAAMESGCNRLETVARDFYSRFGWWLDHRITI